MTRPASVAPRSRRWRAAQALVAALLGLLASGPASAQLRDRGDFDRGEADSVFGDERRNVRPPRDIDDMDGMDGMGGYRDAPDDVGRQTIRPADRDPDGLDRTPPSTAPGATAAPDAAGYSSDRPEGAYSTKSALCRRLETQLASDYWRGQTGGDALPDLNARIRKQEDLYNKLQNDADRADCYENMFIFGRSLRRTRKCLDLDARIRDARRTLGDLQEERASIRDSRSEGGNRDRLIEDLARNNCGDQYRYEVERNRSSGGWGGGGGFGELLGIPQSRPKPRPQDATSEQIQIDATYRTMCVRLCDGFYYPVSFSTLPSNFAKDEDACRTGCAAPAELYVYRNPGGEPEQMIAPDGRRYDALPNAWRFRKEFIQGCSCKPAEYSEAGIAAHENKSSGAAAATPASAPAAPAPAAAPAEAASGQDKKDPAGGEAGEAAPASQGTTDSAAPTAGTGASSHVTPDKARSLEELIHGSAPASPE